MSVQRPTGRRSVRELSAEHRAEEARVPSDDKIASATIFGAVPLLVRRAYPDVSPRENEWAQLMLPGETSFTNTRRGVARVRAVRGARRREPNLSDEAWWAYIDEVTPRLSEAEREDEETILAAVRRRIDVAVEILNRAPRPPEPVSHGLTEREIRRATAQERIACEGLPRQPEVATRLNTSRSTLQRAMKDLKIGPWPPGPPED
jgi:hypothetical protein